MIEAKAVSNNFWILKDNDKKVGEISVINNSYKINIKGNSAKFQTLNALFKNTGIVAPINTPVQKESDAFIYGFPITGNAYNAVWNIKLKMPLYTKTKDSKSWFVAGYFKVKIKDKWKTILCPKLIILQRNEYLGPYKTNPSHDSY